MFKKIVLTVSLSLSIFSTAYADIISVDAISNSEKAFNNQVMNIMKDIENKSITEKNIDEYLDYLKTSNNIKQAVKSNILNHVKYSDYHKVADGIYFCNEFNKVGQDKKDSICLYSTSSGYHCIYRSGSVCYTGNCHNRKLSTRK